MKDSAFEKLWRDALKGISLYPGGSIWSRIEEKLNEENKLEQAFEEKLGSLELPVPENIWTNVGAVISPEEHFKKVFSNAVITPRDVVWEGIAEVLDKKDRKPVFVWWYRAAAGIAALLLLTLPFLLPEKEKKLSVKQDISQIPLSTSNERDKAEFGLNRNSNAVQILTSDKKLVLQEEVETHLSDLNSTFIGTQNNTVEMVAETGNPETAESSITQIAVKALEMIGFNEYGTSLTVKRNKLPLPEPENEEKNRFGETWLGFMSGLAPFDPNISITNFESQALVNAVGTPSSLFEYKNVAEGTNSATEVFQIPLSQPFNDIRTGSIMNLGADYGFMLTKNISFQTGLRYTRGSSFFRSNVYTLNDETGDVNSFLQSHYLQNNRSFNENTLISASSDIRNAYQFVTVPFQLGYHLPIFGRLTASLNGGLSADFLVNNILDDTPEGASKLTAKNSAYRAVNFSGIGNLRIHYEVSNGWNAMVGANVQHAMRSGVEASQNFSFKPRFFGINYGVTYSIDR